MNHDELVALIGKGVTQADGTWADFGAGAGNFTRALRDLLGPEAQLYTVDRDVYALDLLRRRWPAGDDKLHCITADFTQALNLPPLDGILMANALHFVRAQADILHKLRQFLKPDGRLLLVEYDVSKPLSFIPYPVPYTLFAQMAEAAGFAHIARIGERRSPSSGTVMYAALAALAK